MNSGILNDLDIHPRFVTAAKKGGYANSWNILESSLGEVRAKTGLSSCEAERLVEAAARQCSPICQTVWQLLTGGTDIGRKSHISTGCRHLDALLGGGIPCRGVTELAGESGTGKTQLALQLALEAQLNSTHEEGHGKAVAYICTESQFPVNRLHQLIASRDHQNTFNGRRFADNIYVHHLPHMETLLECVRYQLRDLVRDRSVGLVVIDSVASVFRASEERQEVKSKMVQQLGFHLRRLADHTHHRVAVVAVNQVTSKLDGFTEGMAEGNTIPALGLAWSNLVTTRLMLRKTRFGIPCSNDKTTETGVRTLDVVFCPWLASDSVPFTVTQEGVVDVDPAFITIGNRC